MNASGRWLAPEVTEIAAARILEAAERLFAEHGPAKVGMGAIAAEAGCSRATLYRYFESRRALQSAFAHREAIAILEEVGRRIARLDDQRERTSAALLAVLEEVRKRPSLASWISPANAAELTEVLRDSPLIEMVTARLVGADDDLPDLDLARWVLRCLISLLSLPPTDPAEERRFVERFLAPLLTFT